MATKATTKKKTPPAPPLGLAVVIYTKSSSHSIALAEPKLVVIEECRFIEGRQVTGKLGHRMEGKRTFIPLDNVASMIEFPSEDEIWSEPQAKIIRPPEEPERSPLLTSHEQGGQQGQQGQRHQGQGQGNRGRHRNRQRGNRPHQDGGVPDAKLQEQYDSRRNQGFKR